jgi:protease IV
MLMRVMSLLKACWGRWMGFWRRRQLQVDQLPAGADGSLDQHLVMRAMFKDMLLDKRSERRLGLAKALLYAAMVLLPMLFWAGPAVRSTVAGWFWEDDNIVAVVKLQGQMADGARASAARLVPALRRAFKSPHVQAVVLEIDSPGGSPLEAERINAVIAAERKAHPKPVIAVINNVGASAAYMVAMQGDQIYAGKYSLVGSIGAIITGWDFHKAMNRLEVSQRVYASGELKAMLSPYAPNTAAADRKATELVHGIGQQFLADLVERRGAKLAKGVDLGTGEVWGGTQAKAIGLVDEVGTLDEVLRSRWPDAKVKTYGASEPGSAMFGDTASAWLRTAVAEALEPQVALR